MSNCIRYQNTSEFGGSVYVSGTTCEGIVSAFTLNFGDDICMRSDEPIITCENPTIIGDCFGNITPTPTPTQTNTPSNTPNAVCPEEFVVSQSTTPIFDDGVYLRQYMVSGSSMNYGYVPYNDNIFIPGTAPDGNNYAVFELYDGGDYNTVYARFIGNDFVWFEVIEQTPSILSSGSTFVGGRMNLLPAQTYVTYGGVRFPSAGLKTSSIFGQTGYLTYPTLCPTSTPTNTGTHTVTPTNTQTPTPSVTIGLTPTPTPSITASQTETPTQTPTNTNTETPTSTPTQTPTNTQTQTPTMTGFTIPCVCVEITATNTDPEGPAGSIEYNNCFGTLVGEIFITTGTRYRCIDYTGGVLQIFNSTNVTYSIASGYSCSGGTCPTTIVIPLTPTPTPTNTSTPTNTATNTSTPTVTPTSNPVCPSQVQINKVTGAWPYPNLTYNRLTSYTGGAFTGGYYYFNGVTTTFITGATPTAITYSVYEAKSGSTYYTLLSYTSDLVSYAWRVIAANGGSIIDGAGQVSSIILNTNAVLNSITTGGITYPKQGIQNTNWATVIYPSICPTPTPTPSITATATQTPTPSVTIGSTPTPTPSITASQTNTSTPTNTSTNTSTPTQTRTPNVTITPTNTATNTPTGTIEFTYTPTSTPTPTPTPVTECVSYVVVNTQPSLDIPIYDVYVNGIQVTYSSGANWAITPSNSPGTFTTSQTGATQTVAVYYGANIPGQRIEILDCDEVTQCQSINPGGGIAVFTNVAVGCGCYWSINGYDGGTCP